MVTADIFMLNDVSGLIAIDHFHENGAPAPYTPDRMVLVVERFTPAAIRPDPQNDEPQVVGGVL